MAPDFVETGAATYFRVSQAKDQYAKLYRVTAQVYVKGIFKSEDGIIVSAQDWVPVDVESTKFLDRSTGIRYTFVGQFSFRLAAVRRTPLANS